MQIRSRITMNLRVLILLFVLTNVATSYSIKKKMKNRVDRLRNKMNKIMEYKKGEELFLDVNELEYPGSNETLRAVHREQWLEYYECLKEKYARTGPQKTIYPSALMALEGTTVKLDCDVCISPAQTHMIDLVEWYFNSSANPSVTNEPVEVTEHTLISPEDKSLMMYNIGADQAGRYWCKMGNTVAAPFFVHVDNGSEPIELVRPEKAPKATHAAPPTIIPRYNLKAFSTWTEWTECSTCDKVGRKIKYGYCTISAINESNNQSRFRRDRRNGNYEIIPKDSKLIDRYTASEETEDPKKIEALIDTVLPVFRNQIPCRSRNTPKIIQNIEEIKNRKTEIMVGFCKVKCQKDVIFEVRDRSGNVLESANNSAGIYSMHQGMPDPPPTVTRVTIYRQHDKKTALRCPGNLDTDAPVVWQIGRKVINPKLIAEQSGGRIYVNFNNELTIIRLRFADENIYSCWQDGDLAGTVRLKVTQEVEIKFDHHVFMIGAILIIGVFLYVFWKAFRGRKRITIH